MTEIREYTYHSVLAPYIKSFVDEKRRLGFIYNAEAYELSRLDNYWEEHNYYDPCMSYDMLSEWMRANPGEGKSGHSRRISVARLLAEYMNSLGIPAYIPLIRLGKDYNKVHVLSKEELVELFDVIDGYTPRSFNPADFRMAKEYPVLFRFYYCCGMRNNEACSLQTSDIDIDRGIITVRDGKNQKDRIVYMPDDLKVLASDYYRYLQTELGFKPRWFFPGRNPYSHVTKGQIDKRFSSFWADTSVSLKCDRKPTPHCLRHTFVVDRINGWVEDGINTDVMLSYLSKYLGHNDPEETFYYYHMVSDAFRILRSKDTVSQYVIPEVRRR
ncbi:MAG: tyrosine-type recombinase/integrase [Lachnospiraceae bacterium]|nr:tyrosine-type recombinase/integrase [Lachnospiraceae bacterium]